MDARRIAIIGSGAIAGVLAEAARGSGHEVSLCVRTPIERLAVETPEGTGEVPVAVHSSPEDVPDADWVLLTTKVQDVGSAAAWLRRFDDDRTPLVVVQNGVEHLTSVAGIVERAPVLPALIYVAAERARPGHVVRRSGADLTLPAGDLATRFAERFDHPAMTVRSSQDFHTAAWRKMLMNLAANPITALTLRRLDVFGDPDIRQLADGVLTEALAVARAEGAALTRADVDHVLGSYSGVFLPDNGTSMLYDRLAGATTEHEHISGPVVRAAAEHGIATPLNHALLALLRALRSGTA